MIDDGISISSIETCEMDNYRSAINGDVKCKVEKQINVEISEGNYIRTKVKPKIISSIGAVPKTNSSDITIIHDCTRPLGGKFEWLKVLNTSQLMTPLNYHQNVVTMQK